MPSMSRTMLVYVGALALGAVTSVELSGCSLVGLGVGSMIDAGKSTMQPIPAGKYTRMNPGDSLVLHLIDGTSLTGRYTGVTRIAAGEYRSRYERWRASSPDGAGMPVPGRPVRISRAGIVGQNEGVLIAFTDDAVETQDARGSMVRDAYVDIGDLVTEDEDRIPGRRLRAMRRNGGLPVVTALGIETDGGDVVVGLDDIVLVRGPVPGNAAMTGFIVGLAADVLVVVVAASARSEVESGCRGKILHPTWQSSVRTPASPGTPAIPVRG